MAPPVPLCLRFLVVPAAAGGFFPYSVSGPAPGRLQFACDSSLLLLWFWVQLVDASSSFSAPFRCGSPLVSAPVLKAPARRRLQLTGSCRLVVSFPILVQVQLPGGSRWGLAPAPLQLVRSLSSWFLSLFVFQVQLLGGSSSFPAPGPCPLLLACCSSPSPAPAHARFLCGSSPPSASSSSLGSVPAPAASPVPVPCSWPDRKSLTVSCCR